MNRRGMRSTGSRFRLASSATVVLALVLAGVLILSGCGVPQQHTVAPAPNTVAGIPPAAGGGTLVATLTPEGTNNSGSGTARLQLNGEQQQICYIIHVSGIALPATAAHIHRGAAGVNGPIVVPFLPPNAQGVASGCTTVAHDLLVAIAHHPADYYVNVHNKAYPEGAVRGQLAVCGAREGC
ncbi:MAG TPA: CHRD domain-containing protein [Ktedonobacterales bacterium]|nr:CHRD domain-containing protein [Ktedonobacterales bacterium]